DDLFELVLKQEGHEGGASGPTQPAVSCVWSSSSRFSKPPDVQFDPPSEDEMAGWLYTIVKGDQRVCNDDDDGRRPVANDDGAEDAVPVIGTSTVTTDKKEKVPSMTMTTTTDKEMRKTPGGGSSRRSHHGEAHNLTEKRRRHKINERLKTLQQIVPGCSK
ncbi:hypothetical protein ACJX0J_007993, partial [Zea mays]